MLSVNAPTCTFDFSTQKPSHLSSLFMVTTSPDNFPDHMRCFSRPAMKPTRGALLTPPRPSKDSEQARRRQIFLTKVKQAGDNQKWQSRSDQILRADYEARRKRWEADAARSAPDIPAVPEDEEMELKLGSSNCGQEETETVEALQQQEDQKFDALVSTLQESDPAPENNEMTDYGSDDEDFDWICMEVIAAAEAQDMEKSLEALNALSGDMDMSVG